VNAEFSRFQKVIAALNARFRRGRLSQGRSAKLLGVTREHLNRVLNGKRESRRLIQAYRKLTGGAA